MKAVKGNKSNLVKTRKNELIKSPGFILVCVGACLFLISLSLPILESHGVAFSSHADEETITKTKWGYDFPLVYAGIVFSLLFVICYFVRPNRMLLILSIIFYSILLLLSAIYFISIMIQESAHWYELRIGTFTFLLGSFGCSVGSILFLKKFSHQQPYSVP